MDAAVLRDDMVDSLAHESKGWLSSEALTVAMRTVPREDFVPADFEPYADRDYRHLGTRVLSPSTVARVLEAVDPDPDDSVLVVGAGVGYTAAVLAELVGPASVQAVDITRRVVYEARSNLASAGYGGVLVDCRDGAAGLPEYAPYDRILVEAAAVLAELVEPASVQAVDITRRVVYEARSNLASAGYGGVLVDCRDGAAGLPEYAPYDRILVEAAAVRPPEALVSQLAADGRLVMPIGPGTQHLTVVDAGGERTEHGACAFEPLLVDGEQADTLERNRTRREDREFAERAARRRKGWELEWIDWDREGV